MPRDRLQVSGCFGKLRLIDSKQNRFREYLVGIASKRYLSEGIMFPVTQRMFHTIYIDF